MVASVDGNKSNQNTRLLEMPRAYTKNNYCEIVGLQEFAKLLDTVRADLALQLDARVKELDETIVQARKVGDYTVTRDTLLKMEDKEKFAEYGKTIFFLEQIDNVIERVQTAKTR